MMLLRPARLSDLPQVQHLADESGALVCTLPARASHLLTKIERSIEAFEQDVFCPGDEAYFFVLEDTESGQLVGTGAINALAGAREPFYSFRNDVLIHSSRALHVHRQIHALTVNHDLSAYSQLCSFYIVPRLRDTDYPALITLGRLLYMSAFPQRFSTDWMAVMPGIADQQGHAPFWEHVGRKFFNVDYNQAEFYNGTLDKTFMAELMPHHPLYVPLIDPDAQAVMGMVHPDAELQYSLLSSQGFQPDNYVEVFDAGPILTGRNSTITVMQHCQQKRVSGTAVGQRYRQSLFVGFMGDEGFQVAIFRGTIDAEVVYLNEQEMQAAGLPQEDMVWVLAL